MIPAATTFIKFLQNSSKKLFFVVCDDLVSNHKVWMKKDEVGKMWSKWTQHNRENLERLIFVEKFLFFPVVYMGQIPA